MRNEMISERMITDGVYPHCFWHASRRYGYWGVDLYYYPSEYADVTQNPELFMSEPWFELISGPYFTGRRGNMQKIAEKLNESYWMGVQRDKGYHLGPRPPF